MSTSLTTKFRSLLKCTYNPAPTLGTANNIIGASPLEISLANGIGANQADVIYTAEIILAASATTELILSDGSLKQGGVAQTFARVKEFEYINIQADGTLNDPSCVIDIGGSVTHPWAAWCDTAAVKKHLRPGGQWHDIAPDATGYVVGSGSADRIKFTNNGSATAKFQVKIIGASA